jgi:23S rRNA (adenine2503-C2)-methyltransferase
VNDNLYRYRLDELEALFEDWGYGRYRARQLWHWLYERWIQDLADASNLPGELIARLQDETTLGALELAAEQTSRDGTVKRLYRLADGQYIEAVLMTYDDQRRTACISTQAGCAMGCVFCATGQMGFVRNLEVTEIVEQAIHFARDLHQRGERLSNVVFMGMGEPFHNYDATIGAVHRLMQDLGIGARHITISTVGLVPQIRRFADEGLQVQLAISLHRATDAERSSLLPINRKWPLAELVEACHEVVNRSGRRITFEWAAIAGENDTPDEARRLGRLLHGLRCHVNIIPLNPTTGYGGAPSHSESIEAFIAVLRDYGVPATVRVRRGIDIDAGCGQLKVKQLASES